LGPRVSDSEYDDYIDWENDGIGYGDEVFYSDEYLDDDGSQYLGY